MNTEELGKVFQGPRHASVPLYSTGMDIGQSTNQTDHTESNVVASFTVISS